MCSAVLQQEEVSVLHSGSVQLPRGVVGGLQRQLEMVHSAHPHPQKDNTQMH